MFLSNRNIEHWPGLVIDPMLPERLQPASYDMGYSGYYIIQGSKEHEGYGPLTIVPGSRALVSTEERVEIPADLVARVEGKSTWARKGILVHLTAGFIDPGFQGHITLELYSVSHEPVVIPVHEPIAQLSFSRLLTPANPVYAGHYQSQGIWPKRAKVTV